jgi:ABC-type Zn uptake system ZnuABC Zn-binding protein ZnuA/ABC-type Mn2+/Zn2+ transport system permease subunit
MIEPFTVPFVQRGLIEVLLLAMASGLLGTWIVLRGLAFHAHAVGTATFPGLVLADGLGFAAPLGALGAALLFTAGVAIAVRHGTDEHGPAIALVLVACLAGGVILASDVFGSAANVDSLLFGSLLLVDTTDIAVAAAAAVLAALATLLLGHRWLAAGFDPASARSLGLRSRVPDAVLLGLVAVTAVAALSAVGALLAAALLVVPAVTTRLLVDRVGVWQLSTVALAAAEGAVGLWLSYRTDAPPGATIAAVTGVGFLLAAGLRALRGRRAAALAAAAATLVVAGCGSGSGGSGGGDRIDVVASTPVVADLARQVGGDRVNVTQLLQPNTDPHDYEPRPSDVKAVASAQVVLESGMGLDHWVEDVVEQSGADPTVVDLSGALPVRLGADGHADEDEHAEDADDHGDHDPHWWHDPENAIAATREIAAVLARADPDARATFKRNAEDYVEQLEALETGIRACVERVPVADRKLVTDHDALGYFARRYGIEVTGAVIPSRSTQAQPSAGEVADLVRTIRDEGVRAVFPESSVNTKLAEAIARQTGATVGAMLYADTLGPEDSAGATYLDAEAHNADAIVRGLSGGAEGCDPQTVVAP